MGWRQVPPRRQRDTGELRLVPRGRTADVDSQRKSTTYSRLRSTMRQYSRKTHGAGLDCASCHAGREPAPGAARRTGWWQLRARGLTDAETTCIACHATQRPDLVSDRRGGQLASGQLRPRRQGRQRLLLLHQATVAANAYVKTSTRPASCRAATGPAASEHPTTCAIPRRTWPLRRKSRRTRAPRSRG